MKKTKDIINIIRFTIISAYGNAISTQLYTISLTKSIKDNVHTNVV